MAAPIGAVWATITDVERVAPCVPKARLTGRAGRDGYNVEITAAIGPFEITAQGTITLAERDDDARREVLEVVAGDADGHPLADVRLTITLTEDGPTTRGVVHSSVEVGGIATLVSDEALDQVAGEALRRFAANLEALVLRRTPGAAQ